MVLMLDHSESIISIILSIDHIMKYLISLQNGIADGKDLTKE